MWHMNQQTSFVRRGLVWLIPIALIVLGLIFVIASLTQPTETKSPPLKLSTLEAVAGGYATKWADRQAAASGELTKAASFTIVTQDGSGLYVFTTRGLVIQKVVRADQPGSVSTPDQGRTVVSCVEWLIDVNQKVVKELHASVLRVDSGMADVSDSEALQKKCQSEKFG
jgi:hypothetical protein